MKIITMKGLGRVGTACLPVPSIAEIITLSWKKITLTHTRTLTNLIGTEDRLGDIAMTLDIGFESAETSKIFICWQFAIALLGYNNHLNSATTAQYWLCLWAAVIDAKKGQQEKKKKVYIMPLSLDGY